MRNRHGLTRDIPEPIKRQVRRMCGFGCVVCGASIIEYEHVDPEFSDAREHSAANITLLCPQCHSKVTTGMWSKDKIKAAMAAPRCRQVGFASEAFDLGKTHPAIVFGGLTLENCEIPIQVRQLPLFHVNAGEEQHAPFRLTANFCDSVGMPSLVIQDNQWFALARNWDVEIIGAAITIRDAPGHISLRLIADPPHGLVIDKLDMLIYGIRFLGSPDTLKVRFPGGSTLDYTSVMVDNCRIGLHLS